MRRSSKGTDPLLSSPMDRRHPRVLAATAGAMRQVRAPHRLRRGALLPGHTRVDPAGLAVGHRRQAPGTTLGWTDARLDGLDNTQPEHARCSDRSGAQYGNRLRGARTGTGTRPVLMAEPLVTSREW